MDTSDVCSNESTTANEAYEIRGKLFSGEYKISTRRGNSKVWRVFGNIENSLGKEIPGYLACRTCFNIHRYNKKKSSNLVRHKCYVTTWLTPGSAVPKMKAMKKSAPKKVAKEEAAAEKGMHATEKSTPEKVAKEDAAAVKSRKASNALITDEIKTKLISGVYKITAMRGRSDVWNTFGSIETHAGEKIPQYMACRKCLTPLRYFNTATTNFRKHTCHLEAVLRNSPLSVPKIASVSSLNENATNEISKIDISDSQECANDPSIAASMNEIKRKVLSGAYKMSLKRGRSKIWNTFASIVNDFDIEIPGVLACRKCLGIHKYNKKTLANLAKHKCYIRTLLPTKTPPFTENAADDTTGKEENALDLFTKWTILNCRSFKIVEDAGLKEIADFFVSIGDKFGPNVNTTAYLPNATTISQNIEKMYKVNFEEIRNEISTMEDVGYGVTAGMWTDDFLKKSYLVLMIHFIKDAHISCRLLGLEAMDYKRISTQDVHAKVVKLSSEFCCDLNNRAIIVTDKESSISQAFQLYNHIFCINHLLQKALQKSMNEVAEITNLCRLSSKLIEYLKKLGSHPDLTANLKSLPLSGWNTFYYLFSFLKQNWAGINQILEENFELHRLDELKFSHLNCLIEVLELFEEAFKKLEGEKYPTLHLVVVHIDKLLRKCAVKSEDEGIIKHFKEKLLMYLKSLVLENVNILQKVALFLFPPANKLLQFKEEEKEDIRQLTKEIMSEFNKSPTLNDDTAADNAIANLDSDGDLFSRFVIPQVTTNSSDKVSKELTIYENTIIHFYEDFDVLQWWDRNKTQFPLLYKTSCRILATPATSAAAERVFSAARGLLTDGYHLETVNEIMFLHFNGTF